MKIVLALTMLFAIVWLGYTNHKANSDSTAAAKAAQEHIPFKPFDATQRRVPIVASSTPIESYSFDSSSANQDRAPIKPAIPSASPFKCDGRTHCSHMRSCDEATFFIQNCPNTQMDGDHDGVPCERQWC